MSNRSLPVVLLLVVGPSVAQDWPRFRGPGGQGVAVAPGLPAAFTADHVRWRVSSGTGHSSPVAHGGHVFLTRLGEAAGTREIVCFDAKNGDELWAYADEFEPFRQHRFNNHASSSVAADADGVCVAWTSNGEMRALAVGRDGKRVWEQRVGEFSAQHGGGNSAVLHGDLLIVANENREASALLGLDRKTGRVRWTIPREATRKHTSYAPPIAYARAGQDPLLLFASTGHGLTAVDPRKGEIAWEIQPGIRARCAGAPVIAGEHVLMTAGSGGGGKDCAVIRVPKEGEPEVVHRPRRALPYVPGALALGDRFFLFSDGGVATCMEAASGDVVWRERLEAEFFSSPVSNGESIWIASKDGRLIGVAASAEFESFGSFDLGAGVYATPAIADGRMFVRTFEELICLGPE